MPDLNGAPRDRVIATGPAVGRVVQVSDPDPDNTTQNKEESGRAPS